MKGCPPPAPKRPTSKVVWIAVDYRSRWFTVSSDSIVASG